MNPKNLEKLVEELDEEMFNAVRGNFTWDNTLMQKMLRSALTHAESLGFQRGQRETILSVGWHKGEMDFGISHEIDTLSQRQMDDFRAMTMVAIGVAEEMRRKANEKNQQTGQAPPNQEGKEEA